MSVFSSSAGGGAPQSIVISGAANPDINNVPLAAANTEYSLALPANTKRFMLKLRQRSILQVAYTVGDSATKYFTLWPGCVYTEESLNFSSGITLYVQSPTASQMVELVVWT